MKLSVAMCTYNGAKYIREQLDSILNQTLPVDEVVICDDGSTDDTHNIIRQYIEKYPETVSLHVNKENLGVCANFDKAIRLCMGEIIFLADQDDVWNINKTLTIQHYFECHPKKDVVFTNARLVDSKGLPRMEYPLTLFDTIVFTKGAKLLFDMGFELDLVMKSYRTTGCTMAMRSTFASHMHLDASRQEGKPIHDAQIGFEAMTYHLLGYITDCLMDYRLHPSQQAGVYLDTHCLSNNIFTDLSFPVLWAMAELDIKTPELIRHCNFVKMRVDKKNSFKEVIRLTPEYMHHYRWMFLLPMIFDLKKSIFKGKMFNRS